MLSKNLNCMYVCNTRPVKTVLADLATTKQGNECSDLTSNKFSLKFDSKELINFTVVKFCFSTKPCSDLTKF